MFIVRSVLAIVAGIFVGGLLIGVIELGGHRILPPPAELSDLMRSGTPEDLAKARDILASASPVVFLPVLLAFAIGPLVGGMVAAMISRNAKLAHALAIGLFFTIANIFNVLSVPQPLWVSVVSFLIFLPAALGGGILAQRLQSVPKSSVI